MNSRTHIVEELENLNSSFLIAGQGSVYHIPNGYFENFAASVLAKIKAQNASAQEELAALSPLLSGLSKKLPYSVPPNYFQSLTPAISEEEEESSLLLSLSKKMPNHVPSGYFENLAAQLQKKVAPPKVVSIHRTRWMRIAAAAVITGVVALTGVVYFGGGGSKNTSNVQSAAWMKNKLKNVSDKALEEFIQTTEPLNQHDLANTNIHPSEVRSMLKDVSDKEMDAFLEQVPTDEELAVIN